MIFVTTGTNGTPFDRLLLALDALGSSEPLIVQHGPSTIRPRSAECVDFVGFDRLAELVRSADRVVAHAGVGTVLVSLINGRKPFVVPRLARYGEAVDDHQLHFARRLDREGLVKLVEDPAGLSEALRNDGAHQP